jgi:exopolyphosphatase/guanosine-5'-triphosphate,3'-diphosphate pyrophosphatase
MRSAAIDVGSNTLRLLIGDIRDNTLCRVYEDRAITGLARRLGDSGRLGEENIEKSIAVLKAFADSVARHGVSRVKAVGTSALREAENSDEFVRRVLRETGIQIEVIQGTREAELTAKGILPGFRGTDGSLIIDIGGGSTEWILAGGGETPESPIRSSLFLGVVTLLERFVKADPPSSGEITALIGEIDSQLLPLKQELARRLPSVEDLIGTGGTITTLAALDLGLKKYDHERVHMHSISLKRLCSLKDMLLSLPPDRRRDLDGLEKERADLIIPGILLTIRFMEFLGFGIVTVSDHGLLEGLLKEMNDEGRL